MAEPIRLVNAAKYTQDLPHQLAAWNWLQSEIATKQPEALQNFAEMFRAGPPAPATSSGVDWCTPCTALIKAWEGCVLTAYPDPGSSDGLPWTIGYGFTTMPSGVPVQKGMTMTQAEADAF